MIAMGFLLGWKEEERKERRERTDIIQEREMEKMVKRHLEREIERESEGAQERRRFARRREGRGPVESEIRGCESD